MDRKRIEGRNRVVRALIGAILSVLVYIVPAAAAPWWWAQFSPGAQASGPGAGSDLIQDLQAYWTSSAATSDTVIMASYTWYSNDLGSHMINGVDGDSRTSDNGLLAVARKTGRTAPVRVVCDSEGSNVANMVRDAANCTLPIIVRGFANGTFGDVHNKVIYIANKGVMTGSGNFSNAQGYINGGQPNNYVWLFHSRVPNAVNAFRDHFESLSGGTTSRNSRGNFIYHPTAFPQTDTVEVYFSIDDNDSIPSGTGDFNPSWGPSFGTLYDIEDVLSYRAEKARESILYGINRFTLSNDAGNDQPGSLKQSVAANATALKVGAEQSSNDFNAPLAFDVFSADHTCRDASSWPNGTGTAEMHNKFMIFDLEIVATGSANHTGASMRDNYTFGNSNPENEIIIHDFRLARRFVQYWHTIMNRCPANTNAGGDLFDEHQNNKPSVPTNLTVTPSANYFTLNWTAPATNMDSFSRYYVFVSANTIRTNKDIGDGRDDDGDSMIDEDPLGDVDGFSTGSANDDDADGVADDDPWLFPEVQVKGGGTSAVVSSVNVGDSLLQNTDYWFAVVAVDTLGFESLVDTYGPVRLGEDSRLLTVRSNADITDTNGRKGDTVIAASVFVRGDTAVGDTLARFAVKNLGNADSADVVVRLWRDENGDSAITSGVDTSVGQLTWNSTTQRFETTFVTTNVNVRLGTTGKTFLVALEIRSTATTGDSFQVQIDARTCSSFRRDSGPTGTVTNAGVVTIVPANAVALARRGDYASASVAKGSTDQPVMSLRLTTDVAGDTLRYFTISNDGTMNSSDVSGLVLYDDVNGDSAIDGGDVALGTLNWTGSLWRADTFSRYFAGSSIDLIVALSVSTGATGSRTFQGRIPVDGADCVNAETGPQTAVTTAAVFTVPSDTSADTAIVINEFYSSPGSPTPDHDNDGNYNDPDEEYVELYNNSDGNVDVGGWGMNDAGAMGAFDVTLPAGLVLGPRQFLVLYAETTPTSPEWFRYDSSGRTILESGTFSAGTFPTFNDNADTVYLRKTVAVYIDTSAYGGGAAATSTQRALDGFGTWVTVTASPGVIYEPGTFDRPSPNGSITVTSDSASPTAGVPFTLTMTVKDGGGNTVTGFTSTTNLSVTSGSISPSTSNAFASGLRAESVTITGMTGTCTITVRYNTTTTGTAVVTVQAAPPADTRTVVALRGNFGDTSATRGTDSAVVLSFRVTGDTTGSGDTLSYFSVTNIGLADSGDVMLEIWRDENSDSNWTTGVDTRLAVLTPTATGWYAPGLQSLAAAYLGSGVSAGRNFIVVATIFDTSTLGDTLRLQVSAQGAWTARWDSGPASAVTNSGVLTIISANQVAIAKRGDTGSETIAKGDSRVMMTVRLTVGASGDTLTYFSVTNTGSMGNGDVSYVSLYEDAGSDSALTAADTFIGLLPFAGGSTWSSSSLTRYFAGTTMDLLVLVRTAPAATGGTNFIARVPANGAKTLLADTGPIANVTTTATFSLASDTAPDTAIVINEILTVSTGTGIDMDHDADSSYSVTDEMYIELYNRSDGPVNLGGWDLSDASVADMTFPGGLVLGARQYLIVYRGTDSQGYNFYRYSSDGRTVLESGTYAGTFQSTAAPDTIQLRNSSGASVDSYYYATEVAFKAWCRIYDGAETFASKNVTPGVNRDPMPRYAKPSPNATCTPVTNSVTIFEGDSINLQVRMLDADTTVIVVTGITAVISSSTGTITPAVTGSFSAGVRNDSITVTGILANCSVTITVAYNTNTTGTCVITVNRRPTVTAVVNLEARADESGCTGVLGNGTDTYIAVSNASGTMTFTNVNAGTYALVVDDSHHLRRVVTGIAVAGDTTLTSLTLTAGDVNGDNRINIFDAAIVKYYWFLGVGTIADINGSGTVTNADEQWIRDNFGRIGD